MFDSLTMTPILNDAISDHGICYFCKSGYMGAFDIIDVTSVLHLPDALFVNIVHNDLGVGIHFLVTPG